LNCFVRIILGNERRTSFLAMNKNNYGWTLDDLNMIEGLAMVEEGLLFSFLDIFILGLI